MKIELQIDGGEWQIVELEIASTEYREQLDEIDALLTAAYGTDVQIIVRNIEE